uniref:trypsin-like serine peptidase n=1 Tax=Candidatus Electronema sp. TaxID=2698783 RepID=UPI004057CA62
MSDIKSLKDLSVDDLLQELRAREAKAKNINFDISLEPSENLREFDDESIANVLKENQKVIYGTDDRVDVFQLPAGPNLNDVDSVVALFESSNITDNGNGTSTLQTQNFSERNFGEDGEEIRLCAGERFRNQPIGAFCSGFLVASNIIATAGHCVNAESVTNIRFVFGFRMRNATTAETIINNGDIYRGVAIIGRQEVDNGADWALVRLDRPVTNHRIVRIRRTGKIGDTQAVHVIGHPVGLPTKFADGAVVRNNQPNDFFVANLDTYGGNSGSPVFNSDTHEVEGILVRGETDFSKQGNCIISLVCPTSGCRGEDCTRTTEFSGLLSNDDDHPDDRKKWLEPFLCVAMES